MQQVSVVSSLVIPPVFLDVAIPTDKVDAATSFAEEFDHPFVEHAPLVKVSGSNRVRVVSANEVASANLVDKVCSFVLLAGTHLAFSKHVVDFGQTDNRAVRVAFVLNLILGRTRTTLGNAYARVLFGSSD